jgi:hypothetical protein
MMSKSPPRRLRGTGDRIGFSLNETRVSPERLSGESLISAHARSGHKIAPDGTLPQSPRHLGWMAPIPIGAIHIS